MFSIFKRRETKPYLLGSKNAYWSERNYTKFAEEAYIKGWSALRLKSYPTEPY
jgi:hypothetical protein